MFWSFSEIPVRWRATLLVPTPSQWEKGCDASDGAFNKVARILNFPLFFHSSTPMTVRLMGRAPPHMYARRVPAVFFWTERELCSTPLFVNFILGRFCYFLFVGETSAYHKYCSKQSARRNRSLAAINEIIMQNDNHLKAVCTLLYYFYKVFRGFRNFRNLALARTVER